MTAGRTIRRAGMHAHSHPDQEAGSWGGLKHIQLLRQWGQGTRGETISKVEGNAFKRKQMEHLRSQLMTGMDAEISIIPLCILMGNICLSAWSGRMGAFREIVFFHLQDSKDLLGFLRKPMSPSWWSLRCPEPGRRIRSSSGCKDSLCPHTHWWDNSSRAVLNGNQF